MRCYYIFKGFTNSETRQELVWLQPQSFLPTWSLNIVAWASPWALWFVAGTRE